MKRTGRVGSLLVAVLSACSSAPIGGPATGPIGTGGSFGPAGGGGGAAVVQGPPTTVVPVGGGGGAAGGPGSIGVLPVGGGSPLADGGTVAPPAANVHNWVTFGGDIGQSFARTDSMIDSTQLNKIGMAWEKMAPGGVTGTPVIFNDVVYWTDWVGNVHANKVEDGTEVWGQPAKFPRGFTSSPFVTDTRLFLSDRDGTVRALDRATGKEVWNKVISDHKMAQLWSSPVLADGLLIVGLGGKGTSNGGVPFAMTDLMTFHGGVIALKADTGDVVWHWDNTIGPDGKQYGAGVSSWSSAAIDTTRKIAYIGTGNSYYSPASPYSDSIIALKYDTTNPKGELVWSKQFTMNDNFTSGGTERGPDSDVGATPNLFSVAGKDYVGVGDKGGQFYILERGAGMLVSTTRVSAGSATGGIMAPASYGDGILYVTGNNNGSTVLMAIDAAAAIGGNAMGAIKWRQMVSGLVSFGAPLLLKDVILIGPCMAFASSARGQVLAYRISDGMAVPWMSGPSFPLAGQRGGGMSVYGNTLFLGYGFVFENDSAETRLMGGLMAAAIGGKAIPPGGGGPDPGAPTHATTYAAVYQEILSDKGCTTDRCHSATNLQIGNMSTAIMSLTTTGPMDPKCASMKFLVPGNPMASYLYVKLLPNPPCGAQMPLGFEPLKPEEMDQVRGWIEMGAKP